MREDLRPFLAPRGVAVIGASTNPQKLSYGVVKNLLHPQWGFPGPVYPVNPKGGTLLGQRVYPHIEAVPDPVDLAVVLLPAPQVPEAIEACGRRGIRGVIVVSGGFRELGEEGRRLEAELVRRARRYGIRLMGPNGIGVMDTRIPLNTTFVRSMPDPGVIALISQSGALCGAAIDWARARGIGFSRLYSVGNQADLTENDFFEAMAEDPGTRVIALYIEEISDGRRFFDLAREVTPHKPVLFLKAGRTRAGQAAARSHTGALAGEASAYRAACRDAGVVWCTSLQELLEAAQALAANPPAGGRRVAVITNAGGPAALAADALAEEGLVLAPPDKSTQVRLREVLPPAAQVTPLVDMLGGAGPREYEAAVRAVLTDSGVDTLLLLHVPQATVDPLHLVDRVGEARKEGPPKPLVFAFPGEEGVAEALREANRRGIAAVSFPEDGARVLRHLAFWGEVRTRSYDPPSRPRGLPAPEAVSFPCRKALTDWEMRAPLETYGIPLPPARLARTPEEAAQAAREIGFPVALKLLSPAMLHKTELGGVALGLRSPEEVRSTGEAMLTRFRRRFPEAPFLGLEVQPMIEGGLEVIVGAVRDPKFGPMVMAGPGGIFVEVLGEVSFALAPLSQERADALIGETRLNRLLEGVRGRPPLDRKALVDLLVRFSWLVVEWEGLWELDLNPVIVLPRGALVVDARGVCEPRPS